MSPEEHLKKNVDAAMRRISDGRYVVSIIEADNWGLSMLNACEAMRKKWKPSAEDLTRRTEKRVGLEDAPSDYDCAGMEAVLWHLQELAREAFRAEMIKRGIEPPEAEEHLRRLKLEKAS